MRIGFDAKRYFLNSSGLGNYSRDLIRILETYYPENSYIKYSPKFRGVLPDEKDFHDNNKFPQGLRNNLFKSIWRNRWIIDDLAKDQINLYHGLSGEIPVGLDKRDIKSVVTIHDLIYLRYPNLYKPLDRWIYNKKSKYAVEHADKIIAISKQTKHDIIEFYNIPEEKIATIYQSCHPAFKASKTQENYAKIKSKYNLPDNFILNVGSIEPRKNAFQIVKAIEQLDVPLVIIGKETPYADEIKKYVIDHHLSNRVLFKKVSSMEDLAVIYAMADAFVYPSTFEGFGIPIIEALYSGTPVITNKSGVFPEAGGPKSWYIDPSNTEELKHAIVSVVQNTELQKEMRTTGLHYAQQFNDDVIADQLMNCYKSI